MLCAKSVLEHLMLMLITSAQFHVHAQTQVCLKDASHSVLCQYAYAAIHNVRFQLDARVTWCRYDIRVRGRTAYVEVKTHTHTQTQARVQPFSTLLVSHKVSCSITATLVCCKAMNLANNIICKYTNITPCTVYIE